MPRMVRMGTRPRGRTNRTLLYLRISRTKLEKASSTLILCLADVSIKRQPKCFARSRPSVCVMEGVSDAIPAAVRDFEEEGRIRYHSCRVGAQIRGRNFFRRR